MITNEKCPSCAGSGKCSRCDGDGVIYGVSPQGMWGCTNCYGWRDGEGNGADLLIKS